MAVRGIAAGAGAVFGGFLVLDQRGHSGGGGMRYERSSYSEVRDGATFNRGESG